MAASNKKSSPFPFIIIRLWPHQHNSAAELKELLGALKRNRKACDEVWFCTEISFPSMEGHEKSARLMADAAEEIRDLGIEPSFQIANTLGHGLSLLADNSGAQWPMMIDAEGKTAPPTPCPRSTAVFDYIDRMTRLYAAWNPSSIWIDDDLRINSHGSLQYGCFCPVCLREFSTQQKKKYNRHSLLKALHHSTDGTVRLAWTKFNAESLAAIATVIAKATRAIAPNCRLGLQQIGHEQFLYSGPDWSPMLKSLAKVSGHPARARLGHGYYTDHSPRQMVNKAFMISRQISRLPNCVDQICPEIEGFNHNAFGKSAHGFVVESSLYLAMGCNSLSYAMICSGHEPMRWYETLLARIAKYRPFWEEYVRINEGTIAGGLDVRLGIEQVARSLRSDEKPFAWSAVNLDDIYQLACQGLPLCTSAPLTKNASAVILHVEAAAGLTETELRQVFSGGVMLDGLAAMRIQERGFGKWLGLKVESVAKPIPFRERISNDALNGEYAGKHWDSMWNATGVFKLKPFASEIRELGNYEDFHKTNQGPATALVENSLGGRVAVFGYFGWEVAPSGAKRNQYLAAADWISKQTLPVVCQSIAQVMLVPRVDSKGQLRSLFILNASIDSTPPLQLRLRGVKQKKSRWMMPEKSPHELTLNADGKDKLCTTPKMPGWSVAWIAFG